LPLEKKKKIAKHGRKPVCRRDKEAGEEKLKRDLAS